MKCLLRQISAFLFFIPAIALAGWQVAAPQTRTSSDPFFLAGPQKNTLFVPCVRAASLPNRNTTVGRPYAISVSGSLKENVERIMQHYHWRVVWKAPDDYNFDGRVTGSNLPNVIERLLRPFPLQAKMVMSTHTMLVVPRNSLRNVSVTTHRVPLGQTRAPLCHSRALSYHPRAGEDPVLQSLPHRS